MEKKAFLGIDVSKGYADFHLLDEKEKVIEENFQLADNKEGRLKLENLINGWQQIGFTHLHCGVESTGGYENNWYDFLRRLSKTNPGNIMVSRLNPKGVKSVGEASLKRTITDAVSAHTIAIYLIKFSEKVEYVTSETTYNDSYKFGRQHYTCIRMLQKQKVQLSNQLEKLLYQYYPEALIYCRHGIPTWLLELLVKYPGSASVARAGKKKINLIKSVSEEKAAAIVEKAKQSETIESDHLGHIISLTAQEIIHKSSLILNEKKYLRSRYSESTDAKLLCSIPGVGIDSAITFLLEIEDINRFQNAKKLAAYFGISPTFKQSGDGKWGAHMSKQGRGEVRATLYMAILSGIRFNPILKNTYARFRAKGMIHMQASGVIMHKLLRLIFGILKSQKPFDEQIDAVNQVKAKEKLLHQKDGKKEDVKTTKLKAQRYKPSFGDAPISRRNERSRRTSTSLDTDET